MNFGSKCMVIFPYHIHKGLKVSRKSGADSCGNPLVSKVCLEKESKYYSRFISLTRTGNHSLKQVSHFYCGAVGFMLTV